MGANKAIKELAILATFIILFLLIQMPASAAGPTTITITSPPDLRVNNHYSIVVTLSDTDGPVTGRQVFLSVTSPDGASTIFSPVTTDLGGKATADLYTSKKAGYNNITATAGTASTAVSLQVKEGSAYSLDLKAASPFFLADGIETVKAKAYVYDAYGNHISNALVDFTVDGVPMAPMLTDNFGIASIQLGPYGSPHIVNIMANTPGINPTYSNLTTDIMFLSESNLKLLRHPGAAVPVNSNASVVAVWYYDMAGNIPAVGVPLKFTAHAPDYSIISEYTGVTDANGSITFNFKMSPMTGHNMITVGNGVITQDIKSTDIEGIPGDVSVLVLTSSPVSPIYADGKAKYSLVIRALDKDGRPVKYKYVTIVKNGDTSNYIGMLTDTNGYATVNIGSSRFVQDVNIWVSATTVDNKTVSNSIVLRYIAGPATAISVYANPYIVASAEVLTPPGMPNVHQTDITAIVTDQWGHPIPGCSVSIVSPDTSLGDITGAGTGVTTDSGEFTTRFTLGSSVYGEDITNGVPLIATSGSLSGTCSVFYTNNSFLSVKSTIDPNTDVAVNDTINVTLTVRGIGWKIRPQNSSIALIFDTSGSMDWFSSIIYPTDRKPKTGHIDPWQYTNWSDPNVDELDWHEIDTYNHTGGGDIQIMLSSNYRNYGWYGSYYYLKVTDPDGYNFSTDNTYTANVQNSQNENIIKFPAAKNGTYKIYGSYMYDPAKGDVPFNMMVLTTPKRLGKTSDHNAAAKVAAQGFVSDMTNSQIGVVWFNVSSDIPKHLTVVDSLNRSTINASIDLLYASGGTNIYLGLDKAIAEFNSPNYIQGNRKYAILLSDGYSQTPTQDLASAHVAAGQNITIYTIGMGMPDDLNLGEIANITGGNYSRVYTDAQLNDVYSQISRDLQEVIASYTEMHILSNSTLDTVNHTWTPDVQYVPGSGVVHYPNGTVLNQDPDPMPEVHSNGTYDISWKPGTIKLNDTWSVTYSLKVLKEGNITPVRNDSYIYFVRDDGSNDSLRFGSQTIFVKGDSNESLALLNPPIKVDITRPLPKSGALLESLYQPIEWSLNYTGNQTYHQTIYIFDEAGNEIFRGAGPDGNTNALYTYIIRCDKFESGNYTVRVYADNGMEHDDDDVKLIIPLMRGQIILR